jgi:hypothetical protein
MVKVPFGRRSRRGPDLRLKHPDEPPPFGFGDSPLFLCNRLGPFRLIEARDVYRIGYGAFMEPSGRKR